MEKKSPNVSKGDTCAGTTKAGSQCRRAPRENGYCAIHDPDRLAKQRAAEKKQELQKKHLEELLERFRSTASRMGWRAHASHVDREAWKHFSLAVERTISMGGYQTREVSGLVEVVLDAKVSMSTQQTSFYSTGLDLLFKALRKEFDDVPWLRPIEEKPAAKISNASDQVRDLLNRFHQVAVQLRRRRENRATLLIEDEYDVQDLLHALLRSQFDDVRPEEYTPSYAGGSSRMDFLLKREQIVIEVKLASPSLRDREIGEQLLIDISRYQAHPDCKALFCLVYDPDQELRNPIGLEDDLSGSPEGMPVAVVVSPT